MWVQDEGRIGLSKKVKPLERREIAMQPCSYQPSRVELREEFDMAGPGMKLIHEGIFTTVTIREQDPKQ